MRSRPAEGRALRGARRVGRVRRGAAAALLVAGALAAGAPFAHAHGRSTSTSAWQVQSGPEGATSAEITVRAAWRDVQRTLPPVGALTPAAVARSPELTALLDAYFTRRYGLVLEGRPCPVTGPVRPVATPDPTHVGRRWRVTCPAPGAPEMRAAGFFDVLSGHLHLARVRRGDAPARERVFVLDRTTAPLASEKAGASGGAPGSLGTFVTLGIEHIATGWDHLAFLLALLLVGGRVAEVATLVTGFTVAHSATLGLGALGWVEPDGRVVEALVGLSIAVVALENVSLAAGPGLRRGILLALAGGFALALAGATTGAVALPPAALGGVALFTLCYFGLLRRSRRPFRLRWLVAFVFGLVHGLGFAGVLGAMELPRERLVPALLGFNLGVEVGQLAVVVALWPLLQLALSGRLAPRHRVVQVGSAAVLAAGLFWFVSRAAGVAAAGG